MVDQYLRLGGRKIKSQQNGPKADKTNNDAKSGATAEMGQQQSATVIYTWSFSYSLM